MTDNSSKGGGKYVVLSGYASAPANSLLLVCRFDEEGRFVQIEQVHVSENGWEDHNLYQEFDYYEGDTYKLMLVNGTTFAPLCRAWDC